MIQQSLLNPSLISFSTSFHNPRAPKRSRFPNPSHLTSTIRCDATDSSLSSPSLSLSTATKLMESEQKSGPYPGGLGPYMGRDPNVKKPEWLRQRAPQGQRFPEIKESLSHLKFNTVCEEAQCHNIGDVPFFFFCSVHPPLHRRATIFFYWLKVDRNDGSCFLKTCMALRLVHDPE